MADDSQLLRGVLEACVLKIIARNETYGYRILETLRMAGFDDIRDGTLYPVLVRLVNKGDVSFETKASPIGPDRKYYRITERGRHELESFETTFGTLRTKVNNIWKDGERREQ